MVSNSEEKSPEVFTKSDGRALVLILISNLIFFWPFLFAFEEITLGSQTGDLLFLFKPMREYAAEQLRNGFFPFWEPFSMLGRPYFADPQTELFNPFTYLFLLLPTHLAFSWVYFIHFIIGGVGLYFFLRRLGVSASGAFCGSLIFSFSSPQVLHMYAGHMVIITTIPWTPWLLWSLEGFISHPNLKWAGKFGLFLALHLLGGFAQLTYMFGWVVLAYLSWNIYRGRFKGKVFQSALQLGVATLLGLGVYFVQAHASWQLTQSSIRQVSSYQYTSSYSLTPENLITLVNPGYFGSQAEVDPVEQYYFGRLFVWENTCYFGIVSLGLLLMAFRKPRNEDTLFWLFIFFFSFLIALGPSTPFFNWLYEWIPGFSLFRGYGKSLLFSCLALAVIVGKQLDALPVVIRPRYALLEFGIIPIILSILFVGSLISVDTLPFWKTQLEEKIGKLAGSEYLAQVEPLFQSTLQKNLLTSLSLGILTLVIIFFTAQSTRWRQRRAKLICALVCLDLFLYAKPYFRPLNLEAAHLPQNLIQPILDDPYRERVFTLDWRIANLGYPVGLATTAGHETFPLKEFKKLSEFFNRDFSNENRSYITSPLSLDALKLFGVKYILGPKIIQHPVSLDLLTLKKFLKKTFYLYQLENPHYRYFLSFDLQPISFNKGEDEILRESYQLFIKNLVEKTPETVFVEPKFFELLTPPQRDKVPQDRHSQVFVLEETVNRVRMKVETNVNAYLTVNEMYYSGWNCRLNGKEVEVYPANLTMKMVPISAGKHELDFYYLPVQFKRNTVISILSFLILIGMIGFRPTKDLNPPKKNSDAEA